MKTSHAFGAGKQPERENERQRVQPGPNTVVRAAHSPRGGKTSDEQIHPRVAPTAVAMEARNLIACAISLARS